MGNLKYFAFISYTRADATYANRLHDILESYKVPSFLRDLHPDIPESLTPVFLDTYDLKLGVLPEEIANALENSGFLICICSSHTPSSEYVGYELLTFAQRHGISKIIPFLVEGTPQESYHEVLKLLLKGSNEMLAANANERDFEYAAVKTIAYMLDLEVSEVWNRHQMAVEAEQKRLLEEQHRLQRAESRYMAEKVLSLYDRGDLHMARRLSLYGLPSDIYSPDRPLVWQMEAAFRRLSFEFQSQYTGYDLYDAMGGFNDVNISPDGRYVAVAARNAVVYVWDAHSGKLLHELPHKDELWSAVFSNDSKRLATGSRENIIRIWNVEDGSCEILSGHGGSVHALKFSDDDSILVSGSYDQTVKVWDVQSRKCVQTINDFESSVSSIDICCNGAYLLTRSYDEGFKVWDMKDSQCIMTIPSRSAQRGLLSRNGAFCVIPQLDKVQIWSIADRGCEEEISFNGYLSDIDLSSDCRRLMILTDKKLVIWDLLANKAVYKYGEFSERGYFCRFTPCGQSVLLATFDSLCLHNLAEGALVSFKNTDSCKGGCSIKDDSIIAVADYQGINFWNLEEDRIESRIPMDIDYVVISSDGETMAYVDSENNIMTVDLNTRKVRKIGAHSRSVSALLMSPDQTKLMTSSSDGTLRVWDIVSGGCLMNIEFGGSQVFGMAFCPDGKSLVVHVGARLLMIDLDDLSSSSSSPVQIADNISDVYSIAVSHDGKYVCAMEYRASEVMLWDLEKQTLLKTFPLSEHASSLGCDVVFSSDDRNFIVSTDEGELLVYGVEPQEFLFRINAHNTEITHLSLMSDGKRLLTMDDDGIVKIWPFMPMQELIDQIKTRYADNPLTTAEKKELYIEE